MGLVDILMLYPKAGVIILGLLISLFVTIINYFFLNKEKMREIKSRQKEIQAQIKEHQKAGNHEKLMDLNKEMLSHSMEMMKHSFTPMLITMVPMLLFFSFIRGVYSQTIISSSWFWYYLISAIVGNIIFRKLFKLP
ncbi:MAG: EMC3/TMCO1 family protein [Nanoarchaeota archaeon]